MRRCPQQADENTHESDTGRSRLSRIKDDAARRKEKRLQQRPAIFANCLVFLKICR
jgi:hypothetical protein